MNTKSIFASLLISLSFMASCQQFDIAEAPFQEEEKQMCADYNMSSKGNEDVEFAYVRVGVYEAVENHSVTITRMWIEGRNSSIELPVLGNNIVAVEATEDRDAGFEFDTLIVAKAEKGAIVEAIVRERFSISDELGIQRQRSTKEAEFIEYNDFVEAAKATADAILAE